MRRKDREVTDFDKIIETLNDCDRCCLGLVDKDGHAYIVPMNFGIETDGKKLALYFHCAPEGRKTDIIKSNTAVCFEADTAGKLVTGDSPCSYSYKYRCVMGEGKAEIISDKKEKSLGLNSIMNHYSEKSEREFPPEALEKVCVIKVEVSSYSCKEHI